MPSGYTEGVSSGKITDFREYALMCARAFGACVMLRDEPLSSEIPEFTDDAHYRDSLESARSKLATFLAATEEELRAQHQSEQEENEKAAQESRNRERQIRERYEAMLVQARAYRPPTSEHEEYAKFLVSQLEESLKWDCGGESYYQSFSPVPFEQWKDAKLVELDNRVTYYEKNWREEQERVAARNRWVRQLKESLGIETEAGK